MKQDAGYSTDDLEWMRREREERLAQAREDVSVLATRMLQGKDRTRIARLMFLERRTLDEKVRKGRFTAVQLVELSYLCGFDLGVKSEVQLELAMDMGPDVLYGREQIEALEAKRKAEGVRLP